MLHFIKTWIKKLPIIGPLLVHLRRDHFISSSEYWDQRYRTGGNSGAGSYNRLAQFKASFLNTFVNTYQIASVIEYGCGDGAQLKLARYPELRRHRRFSESSGNVPNDLCCRRDEAVFAIR